MKKFIFLLFVLFAFSGNSLLAQQQLRFGNVTLKDTLSGSILQKTGGLVNEFIDTDQLTLDSDAGEFIMAGQGMGLVLYMENDIAYITPSSFNLFTAFYPVQLTTSEINGLTVSTGAMVINSDTEEVWVYLSGEWKILDTK